MGFHTYSKLYKCCVLPVLNYSVCVWGTEETTYSVCKNIQNRAMRWYLGVHRFVALDGLYGDVGWLPLKISQQTEIVRFFNRLINMRNERLTKKIFLWGKALDGKWSNKVKTILRTVDMEASYIHNRVVDLETLKTVLLDKYKDEWKIAVTNKPKLRTFILFKDEYCTEKYLLYNLTKFERAIMAQFRLGILPIRVETGRFRNEAVNERLRILCERG